MKKILFVNAGSDPKDRTGWSGTPFSIYHELIKYFDVDTYVTYYKESKIKSFLKKGMHKLFHTVFWNITRLSLRKDHRMRFRKSYKTGSMMQFFLLELPTLLFWKLFCEASAYSLPIITYDTGGVGDYVINGKNGYRLPLEASGKDFANKIIDILHDEAELEKMQKCARTMYE